MGRVVAGIRCAISEEKSTYSLSHFPSLAFFHAMHRRNRAYICGNCRFHRVNGRGRERGDGGGQKVGRSKLRPFAEKARSRLHCRFEWTAVKGITSFPSSHSSPFIPFFLLPSSPSSPLHHGGDCSFLPIKAPNWTSSTLSLSLSLPSFRTPRRILRQ